MIDTLLSFYRERGESITPSGHSLPQAGTEQSGIPSDERAGSAHPFQSIYRREKPRHRRGKALAASGGEGASIAQMYICALAGVPPLPQCRLRAVTSHRKV